MHILVPVILAVLVPAVAAAQTPNLPSGRDVFDQFGQGRKLRRSGRR